MNRENLKSIIRARLSDKRYHHSLCVADSAEELARAFGSDPEKAYTAGILHDVCKEEKTADRLQFLQNFDIMLNNVEKGTPKLHHAIAGAVFAEVYGITRDPDIINAVRYHTTGRAGMSLLEKIIYIADFISADRVYNGVGEMRESAGESLEKAMETALRFTLTELCEKGAPIHPDTIGAYNEIILSKNT